jgi:hypothetical protein
VEEILKAKGGGHFDALTSAVVEIKRIQDTLIVIDGIDKIGKEGASFLVKICSHMNAITKFKALLTCQPDPDIMKIIDGIPSIEYDKERKGSGAPYSLLVNPAN